MVELPIQVHQHKWDIAHGWANNAWGFIYGGINTCNRLIYQFESLGTPEAEAFIAELRAVRACITYWGVDASGIFRLWLILPIPANLLLL